MNELKILDDDHIIYKRVQYISLKRFAENRSEIAQELKAMTEQVEELVEENDSLKKLLKGML